MRPLDLPPRAERFNKENEMSDALKNILGTPWKSGAA
jgi:hypothetical protein